MSHISIWIWGGNKFGVKSKLRTSTIKIPLMKNNKIVKDLEGSDGQVIF